MCVSWSSYPSTSVSNFRCQVEGDEWNPELLFKVPWDHPEVERLKGRYKK